MPEKLYDVLDVGEDASRPAIQRAYRRKVKECHPDVSDHPDAGERFQLILTARQVLSDPDERERYDDLGHDAYMDWFGSDDENGNGASRPTGSTDGDGGDTDPGTGTPSDDGAGETAGDAAGTAPGGDAGASSTAGRDGSDRRSRPDGPAADSSTGSSTNEGSSSSGGSAASEGSSTSGGSSSATDERASSTTNDSSGGASTSTSGPSSSSETSGVGSDSSTRSETGSNTDSASASATGSGTSAAHGTSSAVSSTAVADAAERTRKQWQARARSRTSSERGPRASAKSAAGGLRAERVESGIATKIRSKDAVVMAVVMLVAYPVFVFSVVWPEFPLAVNLLIAMITVAVVVYTLTEPTISLVVFGTWSVLTPLLLVFLGFELVSLPGLFALSVTWVPFLLAVLLTLAMPE